MDKELEKIFDVIIVGTGFTESLIAAGAARIGKKVLHLDRNDYYGGEWASFSINGLIEWIDHVKSLEESSTEACSQVDEMESVMQLCDPNSSVYFGMKYYWHVPDKIERDSGEEEKMEEEEPATLGSPKEWTKEALLRLRRKFNLDLAPNILFSRGDLVELLIASNVARILTFMKDTESEETEGRLVVVPSSRSDIFTTEVVSLVEKRLLMKFLKFCHRYEDHTDQWKDYARQPFKNFLVTQKLTPILIHFIVSAIGMVNEDADCENGLKKTSHFLNSLGRYGDSPFLFNLYGSGELPQAFCRKIDSIVLDSQHKVCGLISEGSTLHCNHLVMNHSYIAQPFSEGRSISRAVFITDGSIMASEREHLTLLRFQMKNNEATIVLEVGPSTGVCPEGTYIVHMVCTGRDAKSDMRPLVHRLFARSHEDREKPKVLFSFYCNQRLHEASRNIPDNLHLCSGPDAILDYDDAISQAKCIFSKMFPDEEFLPRAPDPEEIKFDDGQPTMNGVLGLDPEYAMECVDEGAENAGPPPAEVNQGQ